MNDYKFISKTCIIALNLKKSSLFLIVKEMIAIILVAVCELVEFGKWVKTHLFFFIYN